MVRQVNRATFAHVYGAVHLLCEHWSMERRNPTETLDQLNQLLFACGWTTQQYEERLNQAVSHEEYISVIRTWN